MAISFTFNPFTGNFDTISSIALATVGSTPNSSAASLSATQVLTLQPADGTNPGVLTAGTQTIGGAKTFTGAISASNLSGTNTGNVTIGTANGLSLVGQALSLGLSSTSTAGALSSTDWNTFNGKQAAGNYITDLTGDVTATGPGSAAATIATNAVSNAKFRQSAALSVVGNSTNATANVADISAASDGQVLRRSGTSVGFGALSLSTAAAVTGALPIGNGGTGQTTKAPAFDALQPMTTSGDLIYGGASGTGTRLGIGSTGDWLRVAGGVPTWSSAGPNSTYAYNGYNTMSGGGNWSTTSGTFTDPAPTGTASLTSRLNVNFGTVTQASSNRPGFTIASVPATGTYHIACSMTTLQGSQATDYGFRLWDGTTSYCITGGRSDASGGGNHGDAMNLTTLVNLTAGATVTFSIQAVTSGGQAYLVPSTYNNPVEWTIFRIA